MDFDPQQTPSSEEYYSAFRRHIDYGMALPFMQGTDTEAAEVTLFALMIYTVLGKSRDNNETISILYRLFLQDILNRTKGSEVALRYQTRLNQTITKLSEVPLREGAAPAIGRIAELSCNLLDLPESQIPEMESFLHASLQLNYNSSTATDITRPYVSEPVAYTKHTEEMPSEMLPGQPVPVQQEAQQAQSTLANAPHAPVDAIPPATPQVEPTIPADARRDVPSSQGVTGSAAYALSDFTWQAAQQYVLPPRADSDIGAYAPAEFGAPATPSPVPALTQTPPTYAQQTVTPSQGVSGSAMYTPADFARPTAQGNDAYNQAPPTYAYPPQGSPTPGYTTPALQGSIPAKKAEVPLNYITGWLLFFIIISAFGMVSDVGAVINYFDKGFTTAALFSIPVPILSLMMIIFTATRNRKAYYAFIAHRAALFITHLLFNPGMLSASIFGAAIWGMYFFSSERVRAVLGPFSANSKPKPPVQNLEEQLRQNSKQD